MAQWIVENWFLIVALAAGVGTIAMAIRPCRAKTKTFYFVYPSPSIFVPDTEKCPSPWLIHLRYVTINSLIF